MIYWVVLLTIFWLQPGECQTSVENAIRSMRADLTQQLNTIQDYIEQLPVYTCGGTGGWRRVVYLDMTDPSTTCPSGWRLTGYAKRTCGRLSTLGRSCSSVTFPVKGGEYSRVCGRIKAYQYSPTDAFEAHHVGTVTTIDGAYVAGISLTHGSPRQHIWTFAAGISEQEPSTDGEDDACPCDTSAHIDIPSFIDDSYFCESGVNIGRAQSNTLYSDDPLWDGQKCGINSTCCSFNSPPYFTKVLPTSSIDNIEARLCVLDTSDDIAVEEIELFVQ